jgi:diguanylate cyclase (GGDEF)-like protein
MPPRRDVPVVRPSRNGTRTRATEPDESLADDRTLSDRDQTAAESDQTLSDADQTAADSDQAAADCDQEASDRDLAHGGDREEHDLTREIRDRSAQHRQQTAEARIAAAVARDAVAHARDLTALARDRAAALRDRELEAREAGGGDNGRAMTAREIVLRAAENRKTAALARAAAADARTRAAADREQAARDREQAARDRAEAQGDREALLAQLAIAETDSLTGARTRAAGLADLDRELDRARRTSGQLVVAYIDVVGLKATNDARGHAAGDALLQHAVGAIRGHLRSYDLVIRLGGDEFLCAMSGATEADARERFAAVQAELATAPDACELTVGFAAFAAEDDAATLVKRADAELPRNARQR